MGGLPTSGGGRIVDVKGSGKSPMVPSSVGGDLRPLIDQALAPAVEGAGFSALELMQPPVVVKPDDVLLGAADPSVANAENTVVPSETAAVQDMFVMNAEGEPVPPGEKVGAVGGFFRSLGIGLNGVFKPVGIGPLLNSGFLASHRNGSLRYLAADGKGLRKFLARAYGPGGAGFADLGHGVLVVRPRDSAPVVLQPVVEEMSGPMVDFSNLASPLANGKPILVFEPGADASQATPFHHALEAWRMLGYDVRVIGDEMTLFNEATKLRPDIVIFSGSVSSMGELLRGHNYVKASNPNMVTVFTGPAANPVLANTFDVVMRGENELTGPALLRKLQEIFARGKRPDIHSTWFRAIVPDSMLGEDTPGWVDDLLGSSYYPAALTKDERDEVANLTVLRESPPKKGSPAFSSNVPIGSVLTLKSRGTNAGDVSKSVLAEEGPQPLDGPEREALTRFDGRRNDVPRDGWTGFFSTTLNAATGSTRDTVRAMFMQNGVPVVEFGTLQPDRARGRGIMTDGEAYVGREREFLLESAKTAQAQGINYGPFIGLTSMVSRDEGFLSGVKETRLLLDATMRSWKTYGYVPIFNVAVTERPMPGVNLRGRAGNDDLFKWYPVGAAVPSINTEMMLMQGVWHFLGFGTSEGRIGTFGVFEPQSFTQADPVISAFVQFMQNDPTIEGNPIDGYRLSVIVHKLRQFYYPSMGQLIKDGVLSVEDSEKLKYELHLIMIMASDEAFMKALERSEQLMDADIRNSSGRP